MELAIISDPEIFFYKIGLIYIVNSVTILIYILDIIYILLRGVKHVRSN